eukprot:COSAG04_NODE_13335_length_610_cov_1.270059_1_plen_61_part_10
MAKQRREKRAKKLRLGAMLEIRQGRYLIVSLPPLLVHIAGDDNHITRGHAQVTLLLPWKVK